MRDPNTIRGVLLAELYDLKYTYGRELAVPHMTDKQLRKIWKRGLPKRDANAMAHVPFVVAICNAMSIAGVYRLD